MSELDRELEDYETDIHFGEASPKPKARPYEEARIQEEPESRSYKEKGHPIFTSVEKAREARTSADKTFDGAQVEKKG